MTSFLIVAILLAQQAVPPEKSTLSGTVVDSVTGQPLGKVVVMAEKSGDRDGGASTTTDAQGSFLMVDVDQGQYHLAARRSGYLDTYYGARRPFGSGAAITLTAGQKTEDLRINLMPFGVIAGTIRDTDGEPLVDAEVYVYRVSRALGQTRADLVKEKRTDDLGQYRVAELPPCKYYLSAKLTSGGTPLAVDHSVRTTEPPAVPVRTFFPGTTDPLTARAVEVGVGSHVNGVDIAIIRTPTHKVAIHVDGPPGFRAIARLVYLIDGLPPVAPLNFYDAQSNGDVDITGVPAGAYTLEVYVDEQMKPGGTEPLRRPVSCGTSVPVTVDREDLKGLRVGASGCIIVEGHIVVVGAEKVEIGGGQVNFDHGRQNAILRPDGSFTASLSPGANNIDLYPFIGQHSLYVKSIRSGNQDVLRNGFTGAPSEHVDLEVILGGDGGSIEGIASDANDKPVAGAAVVVLPNDPALRLRLDMSKDAVTDQAGHFEISNIAPGEYKVFAWDNIEPYTWFDADVMRDVESKGAPVTVKAKESSGLNLHSIP